MMNFLIILLILVLCNVIIGYNYKNNKRLSSTLLKSSSNSELGPDRLYSNANEGPDKNNIQYNVITTNKIQFKRFMQIELYRKPELESIYPILCSIEKACLDINRLMRRISTDNLSGQGGEQNIQGEDQKKLDVVANRIMKVALCCTGKISMIASEEDDEPSLCSTVTDNSAFTGKYTAVFDPLDGSSNIDSGLPTGTIFGIYKSPTFGVSDPMTTIKQRGNNLVVAGYCLYAAATHLVITIRNGLYQFTLDDVSGEFYLTRENIKIPNIGPIYSYNDANYDGFSNSVKYFLTDVKKKAVSGVKYDKEKDKSPSARYMGALVADAHNILLNGGIFAYPPTKSHENGKLRLVYEANPMALIFEQAGGSATNGNIRILDLVVKEIHQRTPLYIGSKDLVSAMSRYENFYKEILRY